MHKTWGGGVLGFFVGVFGVSSLLLLLGILLLLLLFGFKAVIPVG